MRVAHVLGAVLVVAATGPAWAGGGVDKEVERLTGTWAATAAEDQGEKLTAEDAKAFRLVLSGKEFRSFVGQTLMMSGTFTVDPGKKPASIDLKSTWGSHKGKILLGVYERDGDVLRVCVVEPGVKRPTVVASTRQNFAFLMACKRQKP